MTDRTLTSQRSGASSAVSGKPNGLSISGGPSENVRRMQESLQLLFSDRDRAAIIQILEDFQHDRDVALFAENLRSYVDSPIKERHFLPRLRRVFPRAELPALDRLLRDFGMANASESTSSGVGSAAEESRQSPATTPMPLFSSRSSFVPDPSDLAPQSLLSPSTSERPQLSSYSWVDRHGRPVSPPTQGTLGYRPTSTFSRDLLTFTLSVPANSSLGLSIRGGSEFGLGIFVAKVDPDSVAAQAGILPGDQLLRLNGVDLELISHEAAVRYLHRFAPHMQIALRRVGRLPLARSSLKGQSALSTSRSHRFKRARSVGPPTTASTIGSCATLPKNHRPGQPPAAPFDQFQLYSSRSVANIAASTSTLPTQLHRSPSEPLDQLSPAQRETLAYYLEEYREGHVSVDSFVLALSQLTEGAAPEAFEELTRLVAGWVRPGDQSRYTLLTSLNDELTALRLKKEHEQEMATTRQQPVSGGQKDATHSANLGGVESSVSDDFGYALGPDRSPARTSEPFEEPTKDVETHVSRTTAAPTATERIPRANDATLPQRSASAATETQLWPAPNVQDAGVCTEPRQSRDAGTLTDDGGSESKKHKVLVDRSTSASLGMSVEGGAGSRQPLPRIINVQDGGWTSRSAL